MKKNKSNKKNILNNGRMLEKLIIESRKKRKAEYLLEAVNVTCYKKLIKELNSRILDQNLRRDLIKKIDRLFRDFPVCDKEETTIKKEAKSKKLNKKVENTSKKIELENADTRITEIKVTKPEESNNKSIESDKVKLVADKAKVAEIEANKPEETKNNEVIKSDNNELKVSRQEKKVLNTTISLTESKGKNEKQEKYESEITKINKSLAEKENQWIEKQKELQMIRNKIQCLTDEVIKLGEQGEAILKSLGEMEEEIRDNEKSVIKLTELIKKEIKGSVIAIDNLIEIQNPFNFEFEIDEESVNKILKELIALPEISDNMTLGGLKNLAILLYISRIAKEKKVEFEYAMEDEMFKLFEKLEK